MMTTKNLLVELFVEELPPKALKKLGEAFASQLTDQLQTMGLASADSVTTAYASPRRLAAHISHIALKAADRAVQQNGIWVVVTHPDAYSEPEKALLEALKALCRKEKIPLFIARAAQLPHGWQRYDNLP